MNKQIKGGEDNEALQAVYDGAAIQQGQQIYRGARNTLYRLTDPNGAELCVKHFRRAKFPNDFIYGRWRKSKARRSYEHARRLLAMGYHTPQPLGWCDNRGRIRLKDSYYVCRYVDLPTVRGWETSAERQKLAEAIAAEMLRLHRDNIFNRDYSPGNLLVRHNGDGSLTLYHVDLNRIRWGVTDRCTLFRMFRSITTDPQALTDLAGAYARLSGEDPAEVSAMAHAELQRYLRVKRRHRFFKRLIGK